MKQNFLKNIIASFLIIFVFLVLSSNFCLAFKPDNLDNVLDVSKATTIAANSGYSETSAVKIFSNVVKIVLGLSGTVALVLVIMSGFSYLMSKGDSAKIKKSLNLMTTGFIGIVLMVSAYTLSGYIIKQTQRISGISPSDEIIVPDVTQVEIARCNNIAINGSDDLDVSKNKCLTGNCIFLFAATGCIPKYSIEGGGSCDSHDQCKTRSCYNNFCLVQAIPMTTGCAFSNYNDMPSLTKEYLKENETPQYYLCKDNYNFSYIRNGNDSNCENKDGKKAITYTCKSVNGSESNDCNICVSE